MNNRLGKGVAESADTSAAITWRTACTFSLLALVLMIALTRGDWPFTGPLGSVAESVLRFAVWLYIFVLCAISFRLGVIALKRYRRMGDRAQIALSILALAIAAIVTMLVYNRYRIP